ncbi:MAG: hypothetical protein U0165_11875 [Polyangiaceae bacterium]
MEKTAPTTAAPLTPVSSSQPSIKAPVGDPSAGPTLELLVNHKKAKEGDVLIASIKNRGEARFETIVHPLGMCRLSFFNHHWTLNGKTYLSRSDVDLPNVQCPAVDVAPLHLRLEPGETKEILTLTAGPMLDSTTSKPIKITPGIYTLVLPIGQLTTMTNIEITQ